ncbi:MAG: polyprenyl synthetase family protein [Proteobacteria bacterium]|nr:polyprenyl synthetase family protein [Pseudomonadota bacterium]
MEFDLDAYLAELRSRINERLAELLPERPASEDPLRLRQAMRAAVLNGGKRLRPCLAIAACQAVGGNLADALSPACAVELVHCYSLVHDDLPAMDNDELRRGQPTCHKRFGETAAILAGDALLTLAFAVIAGEAALGRHGNERSQALLRASFELAQASGVEGMVGGQALDMAIQDQSGATGATEGSSFAILEQCHRDKTAALFTAAATIGGLAGGGSRDQVDALRQYGADLGLAFQHADDLRDADHPSFRSLALGRTEELIASAGGTARSFGPSAAPLVALARLVLDRAREAVVHEVSRQD